jgi:hypothetical protein
VAAAFSGTPATPNPAAPSSTVDVINAGSTSGLADTVSQWLSQRGYTAGDVRNPIPGEPTGTTVDYGAGAQSDANTVAGLLGVDSAAHADSSLPAGHVRVILGDGYVLPAAFDQPNPAPTTAADVTAKPDSDTTSGASDTPDQGPPVSGQTIPCVN